MDDTNMAARGGALSQTPATKTHRTAARVLDAFGRTRLLAFDRDAATRGPTVEVSHEALLREWPLLRGWLRESRGEVRLQRQLAQAAAEWAAANRDSSFLLSGARLAQFEAWRANATVSLTADEQALIEASLAERERRASVEAARIAREVALQRRARRILQALVIVLLGAAMIAGGLAWWANDRRLAAEVAEGKAAMSLNLSEAQRLAAESRTLIVENGDAATAALLALRSLDLRYTLQGDAVLGQALYLDYPNRVFTGHKGMLWDVGFLPDDTSIYTVGSDDIGTIRFWNRVSGDVTRSLDVAGGCFEVDISFDERYFAAACMNGQVYLWRFDSTDLIRKFPHQATTNPRVLFAPGGRQLMTGGVNAAARLWDVETGALIRTYESDYPAATPAQSMAFTPDGRQVVLGGQDGVVRLWDVDTGAILREYRNHTSWAWGVAVSPDGHFIASTGADPDGARLWDLQTGDLLRRFPHLNSTSYEVAFSADGRTVLTGGWDATARLWDVASGLELRRFTQPQVTWGVALSTDGRYALTGSWDTNARLWDLASTTGLTRFNPLTGPTYGELSPDDRLVAVDSGDAVVRLLSPETGAEEMRVEGGNVWDMSFSQDGRYLATTTPYDNVTRVTDLSTGSTVWEESYGGNSIEFSPDGLSLLLVENNLRIYRALTGELLQTFRYSDYLDYGAYVPGSAMIVSSVGSQPKILIWDIEMGQVVRTLSPSTGSVTRAFAFSSDGRYLATGGDGGTIVLWDTSSWEEIGRFVGHGATVERALDYSHDGRYLASGSADRTVRVWDIATGEQIRHFSGYTDAIVSVGFTSNDNRLLIVTADGIVRLTYVHLQDAIDDLCQRMIGDLDEAAQGRFGIVATGPTCPP